MNHALRVLLTPSCWLRGAKTDPKWDAELATRLAEGKLSDRQQLTVRVSRKSVYIGNSYRLFGTPMQSDHLPSRRTQFKLLDALAAYDLKQKQAAMVAA